MIKLKSKKPFGLEVKRFYLPFKLKAKCPNCGAKVIHDFSYDYFSYPTINETEEIGLYCTECDTELVIDGTLKITLNIDENSIRKYN